MTGRKTFFVEKKKKREIPDGPMISVFSFILIFMDVTQSHAQTKVIEIIFISLLKHAELL